MNSISKLIYKKIQTLDFDRLLGIPYGAIPITGIIASKYNYPMIMVRKERKKYGLKKLIEGEYNKGDRIVIIEDTISTGSSIIQFIEMIKPCTFEIEGIITICDRRSRVNVLDKYKIISLFTLNDIISVLNKHKLIKHTIFSQLSLLQDSIISNKKMIPNNNLLINKLIKIISTKGTNKCIVLDYTNFYDIIDFIKYNHFRFCVLKIHADIIVNFTYNKGIELKQLAHKHNFLIFEGKYFNYEKNIFLNELTNNYKYYEWVDIISIGINHHEEVFNTIKYINLTHNKNISVVYNSNVFNKKMNGLLKDIIIGTTDINFSNLFVFISDKVNNNDNNKKEYNYINCIKNKY